jgi:hypothetical protein
MNTNKIFKADNEDYNKLIEEYKVYKDYAELQHPALIRKRWWNKPLRCLVGFHKIDEDEGWDHYDLNEDYIKTIFYCEKCNKRIIKQL